MAWMQQGAKKPAGPPSQGGTMDDNGGKPSGKSALPPACPRCELMKGQLTKTIQNYQKAYRKKVEGLKTELKSSRSANARLTKQVKQLKSLVRVHWPSLAVGVLVGAATTRLLQLLRRRKGGAASNTNDNSIDREAAQPMAPSTPSPEEEQDDHMREDAPVSPQQLAPAVPSVVLPTVS